MEGERVCEREKQGEGESRGRERQWGRKREKREGESRKEGEGERVGKRDIGNILLVNWYFEPSQPQRIISRLKTILQSASHLHCTQVIKPKIIQKPQNQYCTQTYIKQNIHKHGTQNFPRISPFGITPVKKAHKARPGWYHGPFC